MSEKNRKVLILDGLADSDERKLVDTLTRLGAGELAVSPVAPGVLHVKLKRPDHIKIENGSMSCACGAAQRVTREALEDGTVAGFNREHGGCILSAAYASARTTRA